MYNSLVYPTELTRVNSDENEKKKEEEEGQAASIIRLVSFLAWVP